MKHINGYSEFKKSLCEKSGPCWDGYKIGSPKTKISSKSGKRVNNCVPVDEDVNEARDADLIKQLTDTFDKFKLNRKYEIMMDSLFGGGSKIAVLRKRNTYGGGAMIDTLHKDGGSNYEGYIEILSSRSGRPIPGKSKFDNIDDAMKAATKFVDSIKESVVTVGLEESVNDASNNLEKIFGTDQETMNIFQGIEDKGTVKDMIEFIDEFGNEEMLSRYGIRSTAQVKKLAKAIMNEATDILEGKGAKLYFDDLKYNYQKTLKYLDSNEKKEFNKLAKKFFSKLSESFMVVAVLENAVRDLHFETDPKKAEEMKIAIGISQGEVIPRKQIEGGNYSLRRFRKEIKYDKTGKDLGVFKPGSYMAATSKLGDGPHKKAVAKVKWNRKKYFLSNSEKYP